MFTMKLVARPKGRRRAVAATNSPLLQETLCTPRVITLKSKQHKSKSRKGFVSAHEDGQSAPRSDAWR